MKPYIFFLLFCLSCGPIPTDPETGTETESPQIVDPLLILPTNYQGIPFVSAKQSTLVGTSLQRFYSNHQQVQQFEYENQYLFGYLIQYDSPIDARIHHDAAIALMAGTTSESGGYNPFYIMEARKPNLFFFAGNAAVFLTLDPRNDDQTTTLAKAQTVASQILELNNATFPPFYVDLALKKFAPSIATQFTAGETVPFHITLDYTLASPDGGQIVFELTQETPHLQKVTTIDVTKGMGTVTFADTVRLSSDIPSEGTTVTMSATLLPPYIGPRLPSLIRHNIEKVSEDQRRVTAQIQYHYGVRK